MNKESIQQIIDVSDKLQILNKQKLRAIERFESNTTLGYNSGLFSVSTHLLTYVNYLLHCKRTHDVVVLDTNNLPVLIEDVTDFNKHIQDAYYTALDIYHNDISELNRLQTDAARFINLES
jgi:hypothetical protein